MCGIAGMVWNESGAGGSADPRAVMDAMTDALTHRGPDGRGVFHDPDLGLWLGHRRLSIIDLEGGAQPLATADGGLVVVFNGEIYNHLELRAALEAKGHRFQTDHSDTEVLLHGYREWGPGLVPKLNGMWAFALYDRAARRLFCSRDRFGQKPFVYRHQEGAAAGAAAAGGAATAPAFAFGSEYAALAAHPGIDLRFHRPSLKKYFGYGFIPAPHAPYAGVRVLPPGHNLILDLHTGALSLQRYYRYELAPTGETPRDPAATWGEALREKLERAVKRRLMADVPLGVFLSGGVDSSAVTAEAARLAGCDRVRSFSIGFAEASYDESAYARQVAEHLGTAHEVFPFSAAEARGLLPGIMAHLDEPLGDNSLAPTSVLCQRARESITVALGGDGADELFGGYHAFGSLRPAEWYAALFPKPIHEGIRALAGRLPASTGYMSRVFKYTRGLRGLSYPKRLWNPVWLGALEPRALEELFGEPTDLEEVYEEAIRLWDDCASPDFIDKTLVFYLNMYLPDILAKVDRASMMHSLEVRAPFLDIELVDFVRTLPHAVKIRRGEKKWLLKKAVEPLLPRGVLYRKKQGFAVPVGAWLAEGALAFPETDALGPTGRAFREARLADHRARRGDHHMYLWNHWVLDHLRFGA